MSRCLQRGVDSAFNPAANDRADSPVEFDELLIDAAMGFSDARFLLVRLEPRWAAYRHGRVGAGQRP